MSIILQCFENLFQLPLPKGGDVGKGDKWGFMTKVGFIEV
jgi:hypothetical protein